MIPRYSNEKISSIWSDKNRYEIWLKIEIAVCEKLYIDKKIPKKDFLLIKHIYIKELLLLILLIRLFLYNLNKRQK